MRIARIARRGTAAMAAVSTAVALAPGTAPGQTGGAAPPSSDGGSPPTGETTPPAGEPAPTARGSAAFQGTGMWIWQLPRAGSVGRIAARARSAGVRTVFVKSGDGTHRWGQFTAGVVSALKRAGLNVCGWQYVYGSKPIGEANVAAVAKQAGADCFVIDAESEYQGRYVAADRYVRRLRALVGASFPVALAPFPYVDFHPSFPYSVFLGPGAAQFDQPQMYWFSIGTSVDTNFGHTYTWHRLYKRPIFPLGESYGRTPTTQIRRFRQVAQAYSAAGVSWWEWTQTREAAWQALGVPVAALTGYRAQVTYPRLGTRSRGDPVVWAQQHLWAAGYQVPIDGRYGTATRNAVVGLQAARGLPQTGLVDQATWTALLRHTPVRVRWVATRRGGRAVIARASRHPGTVIAPTPASASLPQRAREIPPKPH